MRIVVIGDLHTQEAKLWRMLGEAGLLAADGSAGEALLQGEVHLVLLGDLVHAKSREHYAKLTGIDAYDEFDPSHLRRAEHAQEAFLRRVAEFLAPLDDGVATVLLGNHDYNAITRTQGPLRSDNISHLEWKPGYGQDLPKDLMQWIESWPRELTLDGVHFAHVGPRPEHNVFDTAFYLENRRKWIYQDVDLIGGSDIRFGVYGHTPVRGGLNLASQGRALLLDGNGHGDEYVWCELTTGESDIRVRLHGLVFDETIVA